MSKEPDQISAFYSKVVDWTINHVPEINYRVVETGAEFIHGADGGDAGWSAEAGQGPGWE